jgi:hypothetical protein
MENLTANIYPTFNGYVAKLNVPKQMIKSKSQCETIIIFDRSGSMGSNVQKLYNEILPKVFEKLNYSANDNITALLFDSNLNIYHETIDTMKNRYVRSGGCTYMTKAVNYLQEYFDTIDGKNIRLLTISDGELDDQTQTVHMASEIARSIDGRFNINSQAVRFFTSERQPDTRGLASILQLNSHNQIKLIDINSNLEKDVIIAQIVSLFYSDGLDMTSKLVSDRAVIMSSPWSKPTDSIILSAGENILWLNDLPNEIFIEEIKINFQVENIPSNQLESVIHPKLLQFVDKLRLLKVINTNESKEEISKMMEYLTKFQQWTETNNVDTIKFLGNNSLRGRIDYFKHVLEKRKKTIYNVMLQIANDDRVGKLNAAQQADYLRTVNLNKNTKALARRALDEGIDFDSVVRKEVRQMHQNLGEINGIDDSDHSISFYSQDTTLNGIRAVCSLVDEGLIDDLSAAEILQMINIVGVAVNAQIGDYPDAMCWRVEKIFPGCHISVSDLTIAYLQGNGKKIYVPGFQDVIDHEITSVIPIFENLSIASFLKKYAPSILEYVASIGIRRVMAGVNMTNCYTLCGGILAMLPELNNNKSTINIDTFVKMVKTFDVFVGKYFDHVLPHIRDQDTDLTFYIANNGLTNMISPIYKLIKSNNTKFMSQILRSIYSFEAYQIVRRIIKKSGIEPRGQFISDTLHKLFGIDFNRYGIPVTPLFEANPKPKYHKLYDLDDRLFEQFSKNFTMIDYLALLPAFLSATNSLDPVTEFQSVPQLNNDTIIKALDLNYDLKSFKLYSLIQSLIYPDKKSRVDDAKEQMLISDTANKKKMDCMIKLYIAKQYSDDYQKKLFIKVKEEKNRVKDMLMDNLISCETVDEFCNLLRNGYTHCEINYSILNYTSYGSNELMNKLLDENIFVPQRLDKLMVLFTARDSLGQIVWNNGNLIRININIYEQFFVGFNGIDKYAELKEIYKGNPTHTYRGGEKYMNRHGHSNDKPSFWALGYQNLEDMIQNISNEEWMEYKKIHHNCCGIDQKNLQ